MRSSHDIQLSRPWIWDNRCQRIGWLVEQQYVSSDKCGFLDSVSDNHKGDFCSITSSSGEVLQSFRVGHPKKTVHPSGASQVVKPGFWRWRSLALPSETCKGNLSARSKTKPLQPGSTLNVDEKSKGYVFHLDRRKNGHVNPTLRFGESSPRAAAHIPVNQTRAAAVARGVTINQYLAGARVKQSSHEI
jgi:hypothetical protein